MAKDVKSLVEEVAASTPGVSRDEVGEALRIVLPAAVQQAQARELATGRPFLDFLLEILPILLPIILEILKNMPASGAERPDMEP